MRLIGGITLAFLLIPMRRLAVLIATAFTCVAQGQSPYRPFPEDSAGWSEWHGWLSFGVWTACYRTILSGEDTLISGNAYNRLRVRSQCSYQPIPDTNIPDDYGSYVEPWSDLYYFRQDTTSRQVFVFDTVQQLEVLLYDFGIGLGPYPSTIHDGWAPCEVVALDSMELSDGWHRTWVLAINNGGVLSDSGFCSVVEGVGSTFGLMPVYGLEPPFEWGDALYCQVVRDSVIYSVGGGECFLMTGLEAETEGPGVTVFPNPASTLLFVSFAGEVAGGYAVFDMQGRTVGSGMITAGAIDVAGLHSGLYLLVLDHGSDRAVIRFEKE